MEQAQRLVGELRAIVRSPPGRWLLLVTTLLGALTALSLALVIPAGERTFSQVSFLVQSVISLPLPFVAVLIMTRDYGRRRSRSQVADPSLLPAKLLAAATLGVLGAGVGIVVSALATAFRSAASTGDRWGHSGVVALGSVIVQVVAALCGAGMGLLLRAAVAASIASVVLPLGSWAVLGAIPALSAAQPWLTPFPSVAHLTSGQMQPQHWAQVAVVALIWVVGLNTIGRSRIR